MSRRKPHPPPSPSRLYRDPARGVIAGVCAGLAEFFGLAPALVRVGALFGLFFFTLPTLVGYFLLAVALPPRPPELYESEEEESFWRSVRTDPKRAAQELEGRFESLERRLREAEAHVTSRAFELNRAMRDLDR